MRFGNAEVSDLRDISSTLVTRDQDVVRLDVTMDHAQAMCGIEPVSNLCDQVQSDSDRNRAEVANEAAQVFAIH